MKDVRMPDFDPPADAALVVGASATQGLAIKTFFNAAWKALFPPPRKDTPMSASLPVGVVFKRRGRWPGGRSRFVWDMCPLRERRIA